MSAAREYKVRCPCSSLPKLDLLLRDLSTALQRGQQSYALKRASHAHGTCYVNMAQVEDASSLGGALPLVLQHSSLVDLNAAQLLCTLLRVCHTWSKTLDVNCQGRFPFTFKEDMWNQHEQVVRWIRTLGHLLSCVSVQPPKVDFVQSFPGRLSAILDELESALAAAAASPKGLPLRAFHADSEELLFGPSIFQQLSPQHLTSLSLQLSSYSSSTTASPLSPFTSLRSLSLTLQDDAESLNPILSSLSHFTQLTRLSLFGRFAPGADLSLLPSQIVVLSIPLDNSDTYAGSRVQLSHMTALRKMRFISIEAADELPPNLTSICAYDCESLQPLRPLQQLQSMAFHMSAMPADILRKLPTLLPKLREVELAYTFAGAAADAASGWAHLVPALTSLSISNDLAEQAYTLPRSVIQQLPLLSPSLMRLELNSQGQLEYGMTPRELAEALKGLTALTSLALDALHFGELNEEDEEWSLQWGELVLKIAGLPQLKHLRLQQSDLGFRAAYLRPLTSLESLSLPDCNLSDIAVNTLALAMQQLTSLDLSPGNERLRGSFMPTVGQLQQLEVLALPGKTVTNDSICFLGWCRSLTTLRLRGDTRVRPQIDSLLEAALPALTIIKEQAMLPVG